MLKTPDINKSLELTPGIFIKMNLISHVSVSHVFELLRIRTHRLSLGYPVLRDHH
jgi:hypothetical protein